MNLQLPSGAVAPLVAPDLATLVAASGEASGLAAAAFAHDEVDPERLDERDARFVAAWAIDGFCRSDEGAQLAAICGAFGGAPSQRLGIADPELALRCDWRLAQLLAAARAGAGAVPPDEPETSGRRIRFSTEEVS